MGKILFDGNVLSSFLGMLIRAMIKQSNSRKLAANVLIIPLSFYLLCISSGKCIAIDNSPYTIKANPGFAQSSDIGTYTSTSGSKYYSGEITMNLLNTIKSAMQLYYVDWSSYPAVTNAKDLIAILKKGVYIVDAESQDEWGQELIYQSFGSSYKLISTGSDKIISADDLQVSGNYSIKVESNINEAPASKKIYKNSPHRIAYNPGTLLTLYKNGNDVILNWTGTGTSYDIAEATDKYFLVNKMLAIDFIGNNYTYANALINEYNEEYFDVTDETEENRASKNNGGDLPAPPPIITISPSQLYIGGSGIINGSNFSTLSQDNIIWFDGGISVRASISTSSQMTFTVPRGAISGNLSVQSGMRVSDAINSIVYLEDYNTPWSQIRTMAYADSVDEYWVAGAYSSANKIARLYYDDVQNKWTRNEKQVDNYIYACATKTDNTTNKRLFCGVLTGIGGGVIKVASTDPKPGSNVNFCMNLDSISLTIAVHGAAPDPNPNSVPEREVVYFAYEVTTSGLMHIKKVWNNCSGVIDHDYGNKGAANFDFNPIVGMVVALNGDLFVAERTQIIVIHPDETIDIVKTGYTGLIGIDLFQSDSSDVGTLYIADNGASSLSALPLDHMTYPIMLGNASSLRAFIRSNDIGGGLHYAGRLAQRFIIAHNDGGRIPLKRNPILDITPPKPIQAIISSPEPDKNIQYHSVIRPSDPDANGFTIIRVLATWKDNPPFNRTLCAKIADPIDTAAYAPNPATPANCDDPTASSLCDNKDAFVAGGVGSFLDNDQLETCKSCGGSAPCAFEFRITKNYGGDNYHVFFRTPTATRYLAIGSMITATKQIYIEKDKMCRKGGLLFSDYGATNECGGSGQPPCCGMGQELPCNQIKLYDWSPNNVENGDLITIFDETRYYELEPKEIRTITAEPVNNNDGTITVTMNSPLQHSYRASFPDSNNPPNPIFSNGHSGGVCVPSEGFYVPNTADLKQPYDDAFINYVIPSDGAGVVPFLPITWFQNVAFSGTDPTIPLDYWNNIWFKHRLKSYNFLSLTGVNAQNPDLLNGENGVTHFHFENQMYDPHASLIYIQSIEAKALNAGVNAEKFNQHVTAHELAHEFKLNPCDWIQEPPPTCRFMGHDSREAWCDQYNHCNDISQPTDTEWCIMDIGQSLADRADGVSRFDMQDLITGIPDACWIECSSMNFAVGSGTIRYAIDPLQ